MSEPSNAGDSSNGRNVVPSVRSYPAYQRNSPPKSVVPRQAVTVRFVLRAVCRWWKVAAPIGLILAVIGGTIVYATTKPLYEATAWLRISERTPFLAFETHYDRIAAKRFVETQIELIRSPLVLGPVVRRPNIASMPELTTEATPIRRLGKELRVNPVGDSELFLIKFACSRPEDSARVVNAVAEEYFALRQQGQAGQSQRVAELLDEERQRRSHQVKRLREEVRELTQQAIRRDPFAAGLSAELARNHPLVDLQSRLIDLEVEREILKARAKALEEMVANRESIVPVGAIDAAVEERTEVRSLTEQLSAQRSKLHAIEIRSVAGRKDPLYRRLNEEILRSEQTLEEVRRYLSQQLEAELLAVGITRQKDELTAMQAELEAHHAMERLLQQRYLEKLQEIQRYSNGTLELEFKRSELVRAEEVLGLITARVSKVGTEQRAPARVTLLKKADVPNSPVVWIPYGKIVLAALACFCLPFAVAVHRERAAGRVSDPEHLERDSHLRVIGEIACLPVRASGSAGSLSRRANKHRRIFEESIDSLRTGLMLSGPLQDMKMLVVTSAVKAEGKTSVSVQLALSLARACGQPTLLIDGDLRAPDIHRVRGTRCTPGLAEVLANESTLKEAIVADRNACIDILPAGRAEVSPHKLFANGNLAAVMEQVRNEYRYIVIDTPPVLAASESLVLARAADASLICAMREASRIDQIRTTYERLVMSGARPVGVVLNGISKKQYVYCYGSYLSGREWRS